MVFALGDKNEAMLNLETALLIDPNKHHILFEYLPQLQDNVLIVDIINKYIK